MGPRQGALKSKLQLVFIILGTVCYDKLSTTGLEHTLSTRGREFVFAFFPDTLDEPNDADQTNDVYISATTGCTCMMNYDDNGYRKNEQLQIPDHSVVRKSLRDFIQLSNETGIENKGIYLNCTDDVSVYSYNHPGSAVNANSYTHLPVSSLNTDYLIPSVNKNPLLGVVARTDNTEVHIILNSTCLIQYDGHFYVSGTVLSRTLNEMDVLQIVRSSSRYDCDFSGTVIQTSSPVAVFSGSVISSTSQPTGVHVMVQVPPYNAFSTEVIVPRVPSPATQMHLRILAREDDTSVHVVSHTLMASMSSSVVIQRGEIASPKFTADTDLLINSDKPILVIQDTVFDPVDGEISMFLPGTDLYETEYVVPAFVHSYQPNMRSPVLTVVSTTIAIDGINTNATSLLNMQWRQLNGSIYSVGTMAIIDAHTFLIQSSFPILVRLHQFLGSASYGYIGGYGEHQSNNTIGKGTVKDAVHLQCLSDNWLVTVDLLKLSLLPSELSHIYLGVNTCLGTLQRNLIVFNVSYDECHTVMTVDHDKLLFQNSVVYAPLSSDNLVRNIQWMDDITCSHPLHGRDSVHIYPKHNTSNHVTVSGQIQGAQVHISLFKDPSFEIPFIPTQHKAQLGQPIYVQVAVSSSNSFIMIVNKCHAHLTSDPGSSVSHLLIDHGCPKEKQTQILASRNQVTRFKFDMFEFPKEDDGMYVTCDVTFCSATDFTPHCQLGCHTDPGIVGK